MRIRGNDLALVTHRRGCFETLGVMLLVCADKLRTTTGWWSLICSQKSSVSAVDHVLTFSARHLDDTSPF